MNMDEAIKTIQQFCAEHGETCRGCPLHVYASAGCYLMEETPSDWTKRLPKDLFENIDEYIQHVGYSKEACGYEK